MKTFKSISDVDQFRNHPAHAVIEKLVVPYITGYPGYRPADDGYLVLIEQASPLRHLYDCSDCSRPDRNCREKFLPSGKRRLCTVQKVDRYRSGSDEKHREQLLNGRGLEEKGGDRQAESAISLEP